MISYTTQEISSHVLTPEGSQIVLEGSHEARVWSALPEKGAGAPIPPAKLKSLIGDEAAKVGQGRAFKNGWIGKEGDGLVKLVCFIDPIRILPHLILCARYLLSKIRPSLIYVKLMQLGLHLLVKSC
jgi:hypothetical protein